MEEEVMSFRENHIVVNTRYSKSLAVLKELTAHSTEAAKRASVSAEKSRATAESSKATEAAAETVKLSNEASSAARAIEP
jgi:hypothetical protein